MIDAIVLQVTNLPPDVPQDHYGGYAYCSHSTFFELSVPGSNLAYAEVGSLLVLPLVEHTSIKDGEIALSEFNQKQVLSFGARRVNVKPFPLTEKFDLSSVVVEFGYSRRRSCPKKIDALLCSNLLKDLYCGQVVTVGQKIRLCDHLINVYHAIIKEAVSEADGNRGRVFNHTSVLIKAPSHVKIKNQGAANTSNIIEVKEPNYASLGIGGLNAEMDRILRRVFASRLLSPLVRNRLGVNNIKGMLLFGPPGTGKTLIARHIGKILNGKEPKIVNGPEVLSKFVGESEQKIRELFADAEKDQRTLGDKSKLHVIIFDEIDAICKSRGSSGDGTGVNDAVVTQLLTKIDGVEALNNVLVIGTTNRKDLLDEALLRPGRLEVHIEIGLPDEAGRLEILQIHTKLMRENSFLDEVDLQVLAAQTKNFSGADLEGLVKSATSHALSRSTDIWKGLSKLEDLKKMVGAKKMVDEKKIKVSMGDFSRAIHEVKPTVKDCAKGYVNCCDREELVFKKVMCLCEQVAIEDTTLVTCLLEGPSGSGKSTLAVTIAKTYSVPFQIVSAEAMVGLEESTKAERIAKVFEDAYKLPLSIVILDDIERLLEFSKMGPQFSKIILQTLLIHLTRLPTEGKLFVLGTTSEFVNMRDVGLVKAFAVTYSVPSLTREDAIKLLQQLKVFSEDDIEKAYEALDGVNIPIKKLYFLMEMAGQRDGNSKGSIYSREKKLEIAHFVDCLKEVIEN